MTIAVNKPAFFEVKTGNGVSSKLPETYKNEEIVHIRLPLLYPSGVPIICSCNISAPYRLSVGITWRRRGHVEGQTSNTEYDQRTGVLTRVLDG